MVGVALASLGDHFREFTMVYDKRFVHRRWSWRPMVAEVVEKYFACGNLIAVGGQLQYRSIYSRNGEEGSYSAIPQQLNAELG